MRMTLPMDECPTAEELLKMNLELVRDPLLRAGVAKFRCDWSGGGDEGWVEHPSFEPENVDVSDLELSRWSVSYVYPEPDKPVFNQTATHVILEAVEDTASETLYQIANGFTESVDTDWYNDDGGFGFLEFDVAIGEYRSETHYNVMSSELGESTEGKVEL